MKTSEEVIAAARLAQSASGVPASISIAQWALESGWGKHLPPGSNNPFGIKARAGEPSVIVTTREVINGREVRIRAAFRKFASIAEAFRAHGQLLATGKVYAEARRHIDDPDRYADALTGRYATDPNYGALLRAIMRGADLYQYDHPTTRPSSRQQRNVK